MKHTGKVWIENTQAIFQNISVAFVEQLKKKRKTETLPNDKRKDFT